MVSGCASDRLTRGWSIGSYPAARALLTGPAAGSIDRTTDSIYSASGLARALNQELGNDSDDSSVDMVLSEDEADSQA